MSHTPPPFSRGGVLQNTSNLSMSLPTLRIFHQVKIVSPHGDTQFSLTLHTRLPGPSSPAKQTTQLPKPTSSFIWGGFCTCSVLCREHLPMQPYWPGRCLSLFGRGPLLPRTLALEPQAELGTPPPAPPPPALPCLRAHWRAHSPLLDGQVC